ncbi:SURF1 family cytochrome oxidase biogenesis protein [Nocardioides silvaticus]|uniref:SURF1 family cytochrome oxidase biogenesis protein n=1 Tax=Nocardioides silvaticus TaxID=2201891 RepID=UPI001FEBBCB7|nr:SURF1 family protein [Nocardioides silvaticus]
MGEWLASWRFLLSRRWILFFLAVLVLGYGTWWLGEWQFGRLDDKRDSNAVIEDNAHDDPVPVEDVLAPGEPVADDEEYTVVEATGTYAVDDTLIVRYRTRDGAPGVDVVVPLVTGDGTTLVVDRGWLSYDGPTSGARDAVPAPPTGEVTITGWVRIDGSGDSTRVTDGGMRAISSTAVADALDIETYGGFVELLSEDPAPEEALEPPEEPDTGEGPHFFYGLQWWFFGLLALGGFSYLAWDERKNGPRGERSRSRTSE